MGPTALRIPHKLQQLGRFVVHVLRRFHDDHCLQIASSLTYTTLLSLVPLLTVALTLISAFPGFSEFTSQVDEFLSDSVLPEAISGVITRYIVEFTDKAARLTAFGIAGLALTSFLLMYTIERAFNAIWRVRHGRSMGQRVLMYWGILTLWPALIGASLTMTTYVLTRSLGWAEAVPGIGETALALVPPLFTIAAFTLLYYVVPSRPVAPGHAFIGGLVAGASFEIMKRGFALYVALTPTYTMVYGTFATIPVFLVWIYASWVVTVLGAVVTALLPDYRVLRAEKRAVPGAAFCDALEVLRVLIHSQRRSETPDVRRICERAGLTREACEAVLDRLVDAGWVSQVTEGGWVLACDPQRVTIAQVYRRFVIEPERLRERASDGAPRELLGKIAVDIDAEMAVPIETLAGDPDGADSGRIAPAGKAARLAHEEPRAERRR
jgi:membrane protein